MTIRTPHTVQVHSALAQYDCLPGMTNAEMTALTGLPAQSVRRAVDQLSAQRLITPVGSRKHGRKGNAPLAWRLTICAQPGQRATATTHSADLKG